MRADNSPGGRIGRRAFALRRYGVSVRALSSASIFSSEASALRRSAEPGALRAKALKTSQRSVYSSLFGLDASSKRVMSFIVSSFGSEAPTTGAFLAPTTDHQKGKAPLVVADRRTEDETKGNFSAYGFGRRIDGHERQARISRESPGTFASSA